MYVSDTNFVPRIRAYFVRYTALRDKSRLAANDTHPAGMAAKL